uniref:Ig-like domain-containing protein n=1 Tax=Chrysemys picta bellii TaxID=8478 RepID=A0A8C3FJV0_CHRPI
MLQACLLSASRSPSAVCLCHTPRLSVLITQSQSHSKFTVIGHQDPVTAILDQEAVLPCHLSSWKNAANMEVRWFCSEFMPEYRGRTELLKAGLTDGNVPLRILNIRLSDEGEYHCFVQDSTFYEEIILELQVAGQWLVSVLALNCDHCKRTFKPKLVLLPQEHHSQSRKGIRSLYSRSVTIQTPP